ncbi:glycosyltransferase family 4 protein [Sphingobacterium sp. DN04309]|uniref:Glycosyltransferase family 4 protein n=1 Tax=Sphingobacterium litopenaei TaxID=2763500 RepID=A0ABR7YEW6_9SPHI|nr:glycosyltransferase family 4 protein [Sphingobacterium litopenaei]
MRNQNHVGKNVFKYKQPESSIFYSNKLNKLHLIIFEYKIQFLYKQLLEVIIGKNIDFSLATTLFSDGFLAYKLFNEFNIPYTVSIRSTDVDVFFKYRPDLLPLALNIIKHAKHVFYISHAIKRKVVNNFYLKSRLPIDLDHRSTILNNGIDEYWIDNQQNVDKSHCFDFVYVGSFEKRKNVQKLISALEIIREKHPKISLKIIGGYKDINGKISALVKSKPWISFLGEVQDKKEIVRFFRDSSFFVMPSYRETFGLVYIEALSQGLPLLYSQNEGVDGVFQEKIGEAIDPHDLSSIVGGLKSLITNYKLYKKEINKIDFEKFRWSNISKFYINILNS